MLDNGGPEHRAAIPVLAMGHSKGRFALFGIPSALSGKAVYSFILPPSMVYGSLRASEGFPPSRRNASFRLRWHRC